MQKVEFKINSTQMAKAISQFTKSLGNIDRSVTELQKALNYFSECSLVIEYENASKPKWYKFWKWDFWKIEPKQETYQPNIDNTGKPPKGGSGVN